MSNGSCYDDASSGQSLYAVVQPTGAGYGARDAWIWAIVQQFLQSGWTIVQTVSSITQLQLKQDMLSFKDATYNEDDPSPFWDLGGLTEAGQAMLVNGTPGLNIPAAPAAPNYYFFVFPDPTLPNRNQVIQQVIAFYEDNGFQQQSIVQADANGTLNVIMETAGGSWNAIPVLTTGLAIGVAPLGGGYTYGGGFILQSLGTPSIQVYICQGIGIANVADVYFEAGASIPTNPHPYLAGFGAGSSFNVYPPFQILNTGATSHELTLLDGPEQYQTVIITAPTWYAFHTQVDADLSPPHIWCYGATLEGVPNVPSSSETIYCCRGTDAVNGFRTTIACLPDNVFMSVEGQVNSDDMPMGGTKDLQLSAYSRVSETNTTMLWEGDGTNPGPGEILDPWAAMNPVATPAPIVGILPDCFVSSSIVVNPDITPIFSWDNHNWKAYTQNNIGSVNGFIGTVCFRVDNVATPYLPSETGGGKNLPTIVIKANAGKTVIENYMPPASVFVDMTPTLPFTQFLCKGSVSLTEVPTFSFDLPPGNDNIFGWQPTNADANVGSFFFTTKIQSSDIVQNVSCSGEELGVIQSWEAEIHQAPYPQLFNNSSSPVALNTVALQQGTPFAPILVEILGGWPNYTISISAIPDGMTFTTDPTTGIGTFGGRPYDSGTISFTISFIDGLGDNGDRGSTPGARTFQFNVSATGISNVQGTAPSGKVGVNYVPPGYEVSPVGGQPPYTFSIVPEPPPPGGSDGLPPGINLVQDGALTAGLYGTPTTAGLYQFYVKVTDSNGQVDVGPVQITIQPNLSGVVNVFGTGVGWVSGDQFVPGASMVGQPIMINGVVYTVGSYPNVPTTTQLFVTTTISVTSPPSYNYTY